MKNIVLTFTLILLFLTGCSQKESIVVPESQLTEEVKPPEDKEFSIRKAIVESAMKYLGKDDGKDCSGFVDLVNSDTNESFYKSDMLYKYFDNPFFVSIT